MSLAYLYLEIYPWAWLTKTKNTHIDKFTTMKNMKNIKSE